MSGTSLLIQWLRIHQPRQGTWVQSLFWEDSTCCGAAKPMCHNYWASRVQEPQLSTPEHLASCCTTREATTTVRSLSTATWSPHLSQLEKTSVQQQRPSAAKNKSTFLKKKMNFLIKKKKKTYLSVWEEKHWWKERKKGSCSIWYTANAQHN